MSLNIKTDLLINNFKGKVKSVNSSLFTVENINGELKKGNKSSFAYQDYPEECYYYLFNEYGNILQRRQPYTDLSELQSHPFFGYENIYNQNRLIKTIEFAWNECIGDLTEKKIYKHTYNKNGLIRSIEAYEKTFDEKNILVYKIFNLYDSENNLVKTDTIPEIRSNGNMGIIPHRIEYIYDNINNNKLILRKEFWNLDRPILTYYNYDENGQIIELKIDNSEYIKIIKYTRDQFDNVILEVEKRDNQSWTTSYKYEYDNLGNYISKIMFQDGEPKYYIERKIEYYESNNSNKSTSTKSYNWLNFFKNIFLFFIFLIFNGLNINAQTWVKVFDEQFIDNSNNWNITNTTDRKSEIVGGKLIDDFIYKEGEFAKSNLIQVDFNESIDYKITFSIANLNYGFKKGFKNIFPVTGFIWGFKNWDNYNCIFFQQGYNNNMNLVIYYKIVSYFGGNKITHLNWTKGDFSFKNGNTLNQISIEKSDNELRFYSNSYHHFFASCPREKWIGDFCGIYFDEGSKVVLDYLTIEESREKTEVYEEKSIEEPNESQSSSGSGIILSKNGYIATNHHVIEGAEHLEVDIFNGGVKKTYLADVVRSDVTNDLALIKIRDEKFVSAPLQYGIKSHDVKVGEKVFSMGYPMIDLQGNEIKLTDGLISAKSGFQNDPTTFQISAPIQPGNSGGPLFDMNGNLIAITSSKLNSNDAQNVNYAIKISYLLNFLDIQTNLPALQTQSLLTGKPLTEMVTKLSPVVVLIRVNDKTVEGTTVKNETKQEKTLTPKNTVKIENTGYISFSLNTYRYSYIKKEYEIENSKIISKFSINNNNLYFKKGNNEWLECKIEKWIVDENGDYYCFDNSNQKIVINKLKSEIIFYKDNIAGNYLYKYEYLIYNEDKTIKPN